jgi:predicted 2-oxoglutarate/Fe(II)-dependent dioxygenase YbiX
VIQMKSPFWKWEKVLPEAVCDAFMEEACALNLRAGTVLGGDGVECVEEKVRNNQAEFLKPNHWLEGVMVNHCRYANIQAGWQFSLNDTDVVQISRYTAGQKYDWHADSSVLSSSPRKLSAVLQLSKRGEFGGGGLFIEGNDESVLMDQGDLVVFPSFLRHAAADVTSGERWTAALWMRGPDFV